MTSQCSYVMSSSTFLTLLCFLVKFSYWSNFHVNIITSSGVMAIFFYKGLTRNPEIGNTHVWVLPNIWRLEWVRDTKFGTNVSNEMLLNATKCQGYSFYRFWVIKEKPTGWGRVILPPPHSPTHPLPRLGLTTYSKNMNIVCIFLHKLWIFLIKQKTWN